MAAFFKSERWFYPAANTVHIIGLAMLFGAVAPLDLRMMGFWRAVPLADLARVLTRVAFFGAVLAILSGVLLLSVNARVYVQSPIFWAKAGFFLFALLNAILLRFVPAWRYLDRVDSRGTIARFRWAGFFSLVAWLGVISCGRIYGYF
nr:hypothetical protein [Pseudovibrio flavus]